METKEFEEHIINRVLEVERKLAEEALKVVLNFIKEKGIAHLVASYVLKWSWLKKSVL